MKLNRLFPIVMLTAIAAVAGCKKSGDTAGPPPDQSASDKRVVLYTFSDYFPTDVLEDFKKETGIAVQLATVSNNEEMLQKLSAGNADIDMVTPSDYMVKQLAAGGKIRKLDRAKISNFSHLDPSLLGKSYDPQNAYSLPLFWGVTGIGYNKSKVAGPVDSWAVLFDPQYKNNILMLKDARELVAAALRVMGKDPNTRDPATIDAAIEKLRSQHPLVKKYNSDSFADDLAVGDVILSHGFNGQFDKAMEGKPDLAFAIPKEGATKWVDNMAIPTSARRAENAVTFLNYICRPEVAVKMADFANYATPNKTARANVKKKDDPVIYPPDDVLKRCTPMEDLGESNQKVGKALQEIMG
jgi:spermidine/putrescine transport system substrate-binding protein